MLDRLFNGEYIYAVVGAPKDDLAQGAIRVITSTLSRRTYGTWQTLTTPVRIGPIRIVDSAGLQLTLQAADGTRFYFDLITRQWLTRTATPTLSGPELDATKIARLREERREWESQATNVANGTPIVITPAPNTTAPPVQPPSLGI